MRPFAIVLSLSQYRLFGPMLRDAEALGDCTVSAAGTRVFFRDYEGVQATLARIVAVRTATAGEWRSWLSVKHRIDAGVRKACRGKSAPTRVAERAA